MFGWVLDNLKTSFLDYFLLNFYHLKPRCSSFLSCLYLEPRHHPSHQSSPVTSRCSHWSFYIGIINIKSSHSLIFLPFLSVAVAKSCCFRLTISKWKYSCLTCGNLKTDYLEWTMISSVLAVICLCPSVHQIVNKLAGVHRISQLSFHPPPYLEIWFWMVQCYRLKLNCMMICCCLF